jgi:tricorn protease interacting factor F2/3
VQIESYDLFLELDFKNLKFVGKTLIKLETDGDVILNSLGLNILNAGTKTRSYPFNQREEDLIIKTGPFSGTLEIGYSGQIPDTLVGIYRAPYDGTYMITTQFEAAHARRMFPCLDHPGYKAEFKLTVKIDRELDAISNMPVESTETEGDMKTVSFQKTPKMSTYLLYLGIGKFEEISDKIGDVEIIVATTPTKASKGVFALDAAKKSLEFYQTYFGIPYPLPKIHLIAIPEFAAGAMENWGAVTFRETALLVDENSSFKTKKVVAEVVAHELAHQWFGDLVTMKWWDDIRLNESLGTFMCYKAMDAIYPKWKIWQDFLNDETAGAFARDCLKNTHPIKANVQTPREIEQIFDSISYGKGASILRMIEAYMGADDFRKGISNYLIEHSYSNADGEDLWNSLEKISGKPIEVIMSEWIGKPGYPIVTAKMRGNSLVLKQNRFLLANESKGDVWRIPIGMKINDKERNLLLDSKEEVIEVKNLKSLKLNVDQTGFYRVYYDGLYDKVWQSNLSAFERWGITSDSLAFLLAGKISFSDYLNLVKKYYNDHDYLPVLELSDQLAFLYSIVPSRISEVSRKFHYLQLEALQDKSEENSSMLNGIIAGRLAMLDEGYAKKLGSSFQSYAKIKPDMKDAVVIAYARANNDLESVIKKYRESGSDEEKIRLLNSMMLFKERSLVALSFGLALSGEVKRQDIASMILSATRNPDARDVAWMWMKINVQMLRKLCEGTGRLSQVFLSTIPILGIGKADEVEKFFRENKIPEAGKGIEAGLEKLKVYDRFVKSTNSGD